MPHYHPPSASSFIRVFCCVLPVITPLTAARFSKYHHVFTVYLERVCLFNYVLVCGCLYLSRGVDSAHTPRHTHTGRKFLMKRKTAVYSSPERKRLSIIQIQIRPLVPRAEGMSDIKVQRLHAFLSVASSLRELFFSLY